MSAVARSVGGFWTATSARSCALRRTGIVVACALLVPLGACGQKGPLVLPPAKAAGTGSAAASTPVVPASAPRSP